MATSTIQCWSCGLLYSTIFDRCPTTVLGCGADREEVMVSIRAAEEAARKALREATATLFRASRSGHDRTHAQAKRVVMGLAKSLEAIELLVTTLRNDKVEQRDATDPKAVRL